MSAATYAAGFAAGRKSAEAEIDRLRAALAVIGADHMLTGITTAKQKIMWDTARAALSVQQGTSSPFCPDCGATLPTHKPGCHDGPAKEG